ncbi:MAG: hypothetical protein RL490_2247 [Pseudomonadota bacterium]|jgi:hypothetical protein
MTMTPISCWFCPKRIGWGWSPASLEGWIVTLAVTGAIVALARHAAP